MDLALGPPVTRARLRPRPWPLLFLLLSAVGCAGDPDVDAAEAALDVGHMIERARWESAPPGCEGQRGEGLRLATCDGAPSLGALVDYEGRVLCVDAIALLVVEARPSAITPVAGDPSPQPNRPPPPEVSTTTTIAP